MIIGRITENQEAIIELEVVRSNRQEKIEAVIDTGYDVFTLSINLINRLGLRQARYRQAILGDGNMVIFELYRAKVLWHGKVRIEILT